MKQIKRNENIGRGELMMTQGLKLIGTVALAGLVAACTHDDDDSSKVVTTETVSNIAEVAQQNGFTALLAAASKAGLADELSSASVNFTVFAPTDTAFTSLATTLGFSSAAAMVEALPASALESVLLYHVLPTGKAAADLIAGGTTQTTLYNFESAPSKLTLTTTSGVAITDAALTQAKVLLADVPASNGIVHAIDKVLVPPGVLNVVQMAQVNPLFSSLVGAVVSAGLADELSDPNATLTVFAPINDAFSAIASTVAGLNSGQLTTVLTYHVLGSEVLAADVPFGTHVQTFSTQSISFNQSPLGINDTTTTPAPIIATDVRASNGVIHVISKVLIPAL